MGLQDTAKLIPQIGLDYVLKSLVPPSYTVNTLITSFPGYLSNVSSILSATPKDTVHAFFAWKIIQRVADWIEAPEIKPVTRFTNQLGGKVRRVA